QLRSAARDTPVPAAARSSVTQSEPSSWACRSSSTSQSSSRSSQSMGLAPPAKHRAEPISSMVLTGLAMPRHAALMFERFTPRARHSVALAQEEARLLRHNSIGTEHVLLGLLGETEGLAARVLSGFGM